MNVTEPNSKNQLNCKHLETEMILKTFQKTMEKLF
jgi:hypothetical protein